MEMQQDEWWVQKAFFAWELRWVIEYSLSGLDNERVLFISLLK